MKYIRDKIKYFGIRTLIKLTLMVIFSACTKENWSTNNIHIGDIFTYDYTQSDNRPFTGTIPINPWTVDSMAKGAYKGTDGYWCHSANGIVKILDPAVINKGNPHKVN